MHTNRSKERSLRIGINARVLLSHRMEGVARYIYETSRAMAKLNPEHEFVYFFDRPYDQKFLEFDNMRAVRVGLPARHPILFKLWFDYSLPKALKREKIDVFYSGDSYASLTSNVPYILVSHDLAFIHYPQFISPVQRMYYDYYFPKFHNNAKSIIAVSDATKQDIVKHYNIESSKIHIGYNATPQGFAPISDEEKILVRDKYSQGKPYFIYLGSLHPRKNIDRLIKAFDLFKKQSKKPHKLLIVGRKAWKYGAIDQAYQASTYRDDIVFLHDIEDEARSLMASATALVYVSVFEGFGIPILEGFSSGTPVITSNISSMPEVAGDAALLVNPIDPLSIANAMTQLTNDSTLSETLIKRGLQRKNTFNWDNTAKIIFRELINHSK